MPTLRTTAATAVTAALVATPLTAVLAAPAHAAEREARCDGGRFQLEVEREDGRFEIDADVDARPGTAWRVVLRHEGRVYTNLVRRTDGDGDIEIDRVRPNTAGSDTFTMRVNRLGTPGGCQVKIVTR